MCMRQPPDVMAASKAAALAKILLAVYATGLVILIAVCVTVLVIGDVRAEHVTPCAVSEGNPICAYAPRHRKQKWVNVRVWNRSDPDGVAYQCWPHSMRALNCISVPAKEDSE